MIRRLTNGQQSVLLSVKAAMPGALLTRMAFSTQVQETAPMSSATPFLQETSPKGSASAAGSVFQVSSSMSEFMVGRSEKVVVGHGGGGAATEGWFSS